MQTPLTAALVLGTALVSCSAALADPTVRVALEPVKPHPVAFLPKAVCAHPDSAARINAISIEFPTIVEEQLDYRPGLAGTAVIEVDLSANGRPALVKTLSGTGSFWLDDAAMRGARTALYSPETADCSPVAGAYQMRVDFMN